MKRTLLFALSLLAVVACSKFDDSAIWEELNKHEDRIVKLETLCNQMNTNITSLQTIIIALQSNDYVVNIAPIMEGNKEIGYTITFSKSGSITIYHGKDGENGKDGANGADGKDGQDGKDGVDGKDGKDGYTPKIGVKQHTDGKYYWTLDGNWILDDSNNMIPVTGEDGKDGANGADGKDGQNGEDGNDGVNGKDGKDGITPQLKIEDGYWYLSYDNGATWQKLGKATGNNGLDGLPGADGADGEDGDSIIDSITQDDENVYFNLTDGQVLTIMKRNSTTIDFRDLYVEAICVRNWDANKDGELSYSEAELVTSLNGVFTGNTYIVSFEELKYFTGLNKIEAQSFKGCTNLWRITLPLNVTIVESEAFYECKSLEVIKFNGNNLTKIAGGNSLTPSYSTLKGGYNGAFAYCTSLQYISLPESLEIIEDSAFAFCSSLETVGFEGDSRLKIIDGELVTGYDKSFSAAGVSGAFMNCSSLKEIRIPASVSEIGPAAFYKCSDLKVVEFPTNSQLKKIGGGYYCWTEGYNDPTLAGAFAYCSSLESIILPASISLIENAAFYNCSALSSISLDSSEVPVLDCTSVKKGQTDASYHFAKTSDSFKILVPENCLNQYKTAAGWQLYSSILMGR